MMYLGGKSCLFPGNWNFFDSLFNFRRLSTTTLFVLFSGLALLPSSFGATRTWTGTAGGNWSSTNNWSPAGDLAGGDSLVLPALGSGKTLAMTNDLSGRTFAAMTFSGSGYTLRGNGLSLSGGISSESGGVNTILAALALSNHLSFVAGGGQSHLVVSGGVTLGGFTLTLAGAGSNTLAGSLSGAGGISKTGTGNARLSGANTFGGQTVIESGRLAVAHASALGTGSSTFGSAATVINGDAVLFLEGVGIAGEALIVNSTNALGALQSNGTLLWSGNIRLNRDLVLAQSNAVFFDKAISGSGGLIKTGTGNCSLGGTSANTYTGATVVRGGTLLLSKENGMIAVPSALTVGDNVGGPATDRVSLMYPAQIAPGATIHIAPSGLLDLNGFSNQVGNITLEGGQIRTDIGLLRLGGNITNIASATGASIQGRVELVGNRVLSMPGHAAAPDLLVNATLLGNGGILKDGDGFLVLARSNSYTGTFMIQGGRVELGHPWALGATAGGTIVNAGGSLVLGGQEIGLEPLTLNGQGFGERGALAAQSGASAWAGPITLGSRTRITVADALDSLGLSGPVSGAGELVKAGEGILRFTGSTANTYSGATHVSEGTLELQKSAPRGAVAGPLIVGDGPEGPHPAVVRIPSGAEPQLAGGAVTIAETGLLECHHSSEGAGPLAGAGNLVLNRTRLSVDSQDASTAFTGVITGSGGLTKLGTGSLLLSADNTCTGPTIISHGLLTVNGHQAGSPVEVRAGGTLAGAGTVGAITSYGGTLSPGPGAATLTCSHVTLDAASRLVVDLSGVHPGSVSDQLNVLGTVNLGGAALQVIYSGGLVVEGIPLVAIRNDSSDPIDGGFGGLPEGVLIPAGNFHMRLSYRGGTGNDLTLTLTNPPLSQVAFSTWGGNGNANVIEPNECLQLALVVSNALAVPMTEVSAELCSLSPFVVVNQPYSAYPDIPAGGAATNITWFQVSTLPGLSCGQTLDLALRLGSSAGTVGLRIQLPTGTAGEPVHFESGAGMALLDLATNESVIAVSGLDDVLIDAAVSVCLSHGRLADLDLYLVPPDGIPIALSTGNGGSSTSYGESCGQRTVFSMAAPISIREGTAPFVGTFRPEGSFSMLRGRSPLQVNRNWRLQVVDRVAGNTGRLDCWSLSLSPARCQKGGGVCQSQPGVFTGALTADDPVQLGQMFRREPTSSCDIPKACPGRLDSLPRHYDLYAFTNRTSQDRCVYVAAEIPGSSQVFIAAYLNGFEAANITNHYLADIGGLAAASGAAVASKAFSFTVPAGAMFSVVISEITPGAGCEWYGLQVSGFDSPAPALGIVSLPGNQVKVAWTTDSGGYQLESSPVSAPAQFVPAIDSPVVMNGAYHVMTGAGGTNRFFRLHKP